MIGTADGVRPFSRQDEDLRNSGSTQLGVNAGLGHRRTRWARPCRLGMTHALPVGYAAPMTTSSIATLNIRAATHSNRRDAFALLFGADAPQSVDVDRILAGCADPPDGLLVAERASSLVGAVWIQRQPGNLAVVMPPRLVAGEPEASADALLEHAIDALAERGAVLLQASLAIDAIDDMRRLSALGFEQCAELLLMASDTSGRGILATDAERAGPIVFQPYAAPLRDRLAAVVERTYQGTLDCPALDSVRDTCDVLDGYRETGVFDPNRWMFVQHAACDVGCLLLADHPRDGQWELVYMGLVPEVRGRGWGELVARHARRLTARAGRDRLVLAVDASNHPAVRMYARAGFLSLTRRAVMIRTIGKP